MIELRLKGAGIDFPKSSVSFFFLSRGRFLLALCVAKPYLLLVMPTKVFIFTYMSYAEALNKTHLSFYPLYVTCRRGRAARTLTLTTRAMCYMLYAIC